MEFIDAYNGNNATQSTDLAISSACFMDNTTNLLDIFPDCLTQSIGFIVLMSLVHGLVCYFGTYVNAVVIFVAFRKPRLRRNVRNLLLFNMAAADFCVTLATVPTNLLVMTITPWILGETVCKLISYIQNVSEFASVYFIVAVSFHRCMDIITPLGEPQRRFAKWKAILLITLIWTTAITIPLPSEVLVITGLDGLPYCQQMWNDGMFQVIYSASAFPVGRFLLPLIVILTCHGITLRGLLKTVSSCSRNSRDILQRRRKRNCKAVKMMIGLTFVFIFCWLPLNCLLVYLRFFEGGDENQGLFKILVPSAHLMGVLNSCLNPILYDFLNKDIYQAICMEVPITPRICRCFNIATRFGEDADFSSRVASCGNTVWVLQRQQRRSISVPSDLNSLYVEPKSKRRRFESRSFNNYLLGGGASNSKSRSLESVANV